MPKNQNQQQKMLYIKAMLERETDREHGLSMADFLARLKELGIEAERKSVYDDIECLRASGMDIKLARGKKFTYYLDSRPFETAELKLLVDAVQVAKALTAEQSRQLIKKIEQLTGIYEAKSSIVMSSYKVVPRRSTKMYTMPSMPFTKPSSKIARYGSAILTGR